MSEIVKFPTRGTSGDIVIKISGYWNGPLFYFDVSWDAAPDDDPRIALTNNFDGAVRAAFEHAEKVGLDRVRFTLTVEDMAGGVA